MTLEPKGFWHHTEINGQKISHWWPSLEDYEIFIKAGQEFVDDHKRKMFYGDKLKP